MRHVSITRTTVAILLAPALVAMWPLTCADAHAAPPPPTATNSQPPLATGAVNLTAVNIAHASNGVQGSGLLLDPFGRPMASARISLLLDATELAVTTTRPDGHFTVTAPLPPKTAPGPHDVQLVWAGGPGQEGVAITRRMEVGHKVGTSTTVTTSAGAPAGGLVTISGTVLDEKRQPVAGLDVVAKDDHGVWSTDMSTDAKGAFAGTLRVPVGSAPQERILTVVVDGDQVHAGSRASAKFRVLPGGATPRPDTGGVGSASPSASSSPASGTDDRAVPSELISPQPESSSRTRTTTPGRPTHALALSGLAVVGILFSLACLGAGRRHEDDDFDHLIEDDSFDQGSR